jgi:tRNA(Ile2) C34 agmatinyltransferase TiaS
MSVKCPYCRHRWNYSGRSKTHAQCPKCKTWLRIKPYKRLVDNPKIICGQQVFVFR